MANNFFENDTNRFLIASQFFNQASPKTPLGALAKTLAGLTYGLGQRQIQKETQARRQQLPQALQQVASGQNLSQETLQQVAAANPQLASQLAMGQRQNVFEQQQQSAASQSQENILQDKQQFQSLEAEKDRQLKRDLSNLNMLIESKKIKQSAVTPFEKKLQEETAKSLVEARVGLIDVSNTHKDITRKLGQIEKALPTAITGGWVPVLQLIARFGPQKAANRLGITAEKLKATRDVESALKSMVGSVLKSTFGGVVSEGERAFLEDAFGKPTQTQEEIARGLEIVRKWQNTALEGARRKVNELIGSAAQFSKNSDISAFAPNSGGPTKKTVDKFEELGLQ